MNTIKIPLTAEEKRARRNAAARKYYETHKEQIKAACKKCRAMKKAVADGDPVVEQPKAELPKAKAIIARHAINPEKKVKTVRKADLTKKLKEKITAIKKEQTGVMKQLDKAEKIVQKLRAKLLKLSETELGLQKKLVEAQTI